MSANENPFAALERDEKIYRRPKFWLAAFIAIAGVVLFLVFYKTTVKEIWSEDEVARSVEIVPRDSLWVDKKGLHGEVIIVPSLTFRVRNRGQRPLSFLCIDGEFSYQETKERMWSGYVEVFKGTPLPPGGESEDIQLKSWNGYTATSKQAFFANLPEWKKIELTLFAKTQGSGYVKVGTFPIRQAIAGVTEPDVPVPAAEGPTR